MGHKRQAASANRTATGARTARGDLGVDPAMFRRAACQRRARGTVASGTADKDSEKIVRRYADFFERAVGGGGCSVVKGAAGLARASASAQAVVIAPRRWHDRDHGQRFIGRQTFR
jgi:hypothetical protein